MLLEKIVVLEQFVEGNMEEINFRDKLLADEKVKSFNKDGDLHKKQVVIEDMESLIKTLEKGIKALEKSQNENKGSDEEINKLKLDLQKSRSIIEERNNQIAELKTDSINLCHSKEHFMKQQDDVMKLNESLQKQIIFKEKEIKELNEEINDFEAEKVAFKRKEVVSFNQHKGEVQSLNDDIENNRTNFVKRINVLEDQLACEHEERFRVLREKHQLENKVSELENDNEKDEMINKLKADLRKRGILLKDAQNLVDKLQQENSKKLMVKQLKNQIEDLEYENIAAVRGRKNAELELEEMKLQLEDITKTKVKLEDKYFATIRENASLSTQILENEEELQEMLKKYKSSVAAISTDQITLQDQAMTIIELENENDKLEERVSELSIKIVQLEEDTANVSQHKGLQLKVSDLEQRLELEQTARQRMETQIDRLKESVKRMDKEADEMRFKSQSDQEKNRKILNQFRDLKEDYMSLQGKEADVSEKNNHLNKKIEIAEAENIVMKKELELALKRIDDFHIAINSEIDSDTDTVNYSEASEEDIEVFLDNHRRAMSMQRERESVIRESIAKEISDVVEE